MRDYPAIAEGYIAGVMDGSIMVCRKVRLTIERHVRDLRAAESADYPYFFDREACKKWCKLFELVRPSKWPTTMVMGPWLIACTYILYGWKRREPVEIGKDKKGQPIYTHVRRFRQAYFRWPRKTGKSAYLSVLGLGHLIIDGERGAEVYSAALVEEQARRVFDESVAMRDGTPALRAEIVKLGDAPCRRLRVPETNSEFRPLSRDKETMEGLNVSFAACDEVHKWKGRGAWDVLRYGMRSRVQPLLVGITTAPSADDTTSICNSLENYAEKVLTGVIDDPAFFCWILEIDTEVRNAAGEVIQEADRWDDETKWAKACPNLGVTVKIEDMRQEALEARHDKEALNAFMRYSLNVRVDALEQPIQTADWDACARPGDPAQLREEALLRLAGRICFAALDLALTDDTSALGLVFPWMPGDETREVPMMDPASRETSTVTVYPWHFINFYWIPAENIQRRVEKHQVPYDTWRDMGFLLTTPGKVTDHDFIAAQILALNKIFDLRELAYDPALANGLIKKLLQSGFKQDRVVKFAQTAMNYAAPCGDFVRAVARREVSHDGDPVTRWQVTNLRWKKNHTGLIMPDKDKSIEKIDGVVADLMSYGRGTHPDNAKLLKAKPKVTLL